MAYTPINWQTGDTITAEKLNKMDNGWSVTTNTQTLLEETVTTADSGGMKVGTFVYSGVIDMDTITVTFDGDEYTCSRIEAFDGFFYGGFSQEGPVFTEYPFFISSHNGYDQIYTETAGTYTVKIEVVLESVETSDDFNQVRGWGVTTTKQALFDGSVTTSGEYIEGNISTSKTVNEDIILVTFNGTEYECPNIGSEDPEYGAPYGESSYDFSTFPFNLYTNGDNTMIITTETAGTYTVKIEVTGQGVEVTSVFRDAVNASVQMPKILECVEGVTTIDDAQNMLNNGGIVYFTAAEDTYEGALKKLFFIQAPAMTSTIFPTSTKIQASFNRDSGLFYISRSGS